MAEFLYRYTDQGAGTEIGERREYYPYGQGYRFEENLTVLHTFRVVSRTPAGCWIFLPYVGRSGRKFVRTGTKKCFARPTKAEALFDYKQRKQKQFGILKGQLRRTEERLALIETLEESFKETPAEANGQ